MTAEIAELYLSGLTLKQVGERYGRSVEWARKILRAEGVARRRPGPEKGSRLGEIRTDKPTYGAQHARVRAQRGTPSECAQCGVTEARNFDWANLTGNYDDIWDYARMCRSCHRQYDNARRLRDGN